MSEIARVESIAELRAFRVALVKFVDACNVALGDAESDMQRTYSWVERDQISYWNGQLAKRAETVGRAKEALRMKKLYKSPTGGEQSAVDEEKALRVAIRMHEEAEQKIVACKQWARRLQKEIMLYKGGVSRLTSVLGGEVPRALAKLEVMANSLEAYATLEADSPGAGLIGGSVGSMMRSADEAATRFTSLDVAGLRENVPTLDVRAAAPEDDIRDQTWTLPQLSAEARQAVSDLKQSAARIDPDTTLVIARGTWSATEIFLERRLSDLPRDSGWYIASTTVAGIVALNKVLVRDLLEVRPDFAELLSLNDGFLALVDSGGVRSIYTSAGDDLWAGFRARNAVKTETA
jgi:hypothetical protein